ncbi:MAG TPA: mechanosensitive ion channel domain-containing protein [Candidatus Acidoferrales bacterium]|nr:mechanosensitive ion channel domain-containing protein [Candidatus Acidoferrales bacterium]
MKRFEKLILITLLALFAVSLAAIVFTHGWANYRDQLRALRKKAEHTQELVDTRPLTTAQQVATLAVARTEQDYAGDALRLADRSVDLAFAIAIRDAAANPPPLTPQTRELNARIQAGETAIAADQARITQFTQVLAKVPANAKDDINGLILTAQAQLALDQDDLDAAKQELILAGGDRQAQIQHLLDQHKASDTSGAAVSSAASAAAASSIERTQSRSLVDQFRAWNSLRAKSSQLAQAQQEANALVLALSSTRDEVQKELSQGQVQKNPGSRGSAKPPLENSATPAQEPSAVSLLHNLSEAQKNLADIGKRVEVEQQLAATYGDWMTFVGVREKAFLHGMIVAISWILLIAVCIVLLNALVQRFFADVNLERRQLRTIQAVVLFALQAVGLLLILLVIFGVPGNLATVLALAGAGLTVALKDFIVGFLGWFVLMGKDGLRVGDWVEINGVGGEVLKIGPLHTVIMETGNWTDAGHPTGRKVSFVNSFAIEGHYFNFSTSGQWLWDEIEVLVPQGAEPHAIAEEIRKIAAEETAKNAQLAEQEWNRVAQATGTSFSARPSLDIRPTDLGITVVVRYITRANERYEVRARLNRAIVELLQKKIPGAVVSKPPAQAASERA